MTIIISDNPKVIKKFIKSNGEVKDGTIEENYEAPGNNVGTTPGANRLSRKIEKNTEATKGKKICLGCSSEAKDGYDYCASCLPHINL